MRKELVTAVLVLAAGTGLALGESESSTSPALLPTTVAVSQAAQPHSPYSAEQVPHDAWTSEGTPGLCPGAPCAKTDWVCDDPGCFWLRAEYLHWWTKDSRLPVLITTATPGATLLPGALGQPGTVGLFGGSGLEDDERSGGRFTGGFWLNECHTVGLEGSYFFLGSRSASFDAASTGVLGSAVIARPFFDVLSGTENAQLVAFPGIASGDIHLRYFSRLQGAELNAIYNVCCCPRCEPECAHECGWYYRLELLSGFRFLDLDEGLGITETARVNPALPSGSPFFGGNTITMADQFNAHNYFYGGQVGVRTEVRRGRLFVEAVGKVALGETREIVDIHGATAITPLGGTPVVTPVGFLASGSNSGHFTRDKFAVVPEAGINVGCQVTDHLRAFVGYTFLYWSSVVRPGDQIDVGLSGTQIPTDTRFNPQAGPARPAFLLRDTSFWTQGINVGMEFRY